MAQTSAETLDTPPCADDNGSETAPPRRREISGIVLLAAALLLGPALLSYHLGDGRLMGPLGGSLARTCYALFGLPTYLVVVLLGVVGLRVLAEKPVVPSATDVVGYGSAALAAMLLCHLAGASARVDGAAPGGVLGEFFGELARAGLGAAGAWLLATTMLVTGLVLASELSVVALARTVYARIAAHRKAKAAGAPPEPVIVEITHRKQAKVVTAAAFPEPMDSEEPTIEMEAPDFGALDEREPTIVEPEYRRHKKSPVARAPRRVGAYRLPDPALLQYEDQQLGKLDEAEMMELAARLVEALASYKIEGHVSEIHPGPVVTMYEFVPKAGTRLTKINQLSGDLAMALKASRPVRIVAPLPGKGAVGIEVPNRRREKVFLREIITDDVFVKSSARLPMCLGKDIEGKAVSVDLQRMPHLLVAGTTGSGKSVALNAMITSILYHATPDQVRMILVDPKMVELSIYDGIPHLLLPVVTDAQKASLALRWAVDEMERRYRLIYETRVRHIEAYNEKQADAANKLPYLVVVIDELADLMTIAPKDVEWSVQRLAQKARAAGIHVILATQRPSVDVITPVIRANFPVRVAFYVKDAVNSRVILDQAGAEPLLGAGDMLHQDKDLVQRVHGAYVSEEEIHAVVEFLKAQGSPEYNMDILRPREEEDDGRGDADCGPVDEMYARAIDFVRQTRIASISRLQRELGVGYNRAAKMIERMEKDGIVGPGDGAKPREVMGGVASFAAGAPPPLPM